MQRTFNRVQLSEVFTSIEGEGILFGTKTMFIRMAGCPLNCRWCDTAYALPIDSGTTFSLSEAKELIMKNLQPNTYKVNFSGGEPLIQHEAVLELADFVQEKLKIKTYLESSCFDSVRFAKVLPYIDICKVEFKMKDSNVVGASDYENLLQNEIDCLRIAVIDKKIVYIKIVITKSSSLVEFRYLIESIFERIKALEIRGFIIQPSWGLDEPTTHQLFDFYDVIFPLYHDVRIIPQLHKVLGVR